MGQARSFNGGIIPFAGKMSEARFVAYTRFRGVVNTASRIWMVRDWAKRNGYHLEGAPSCLFVSPNGNPGETQCEVQWAIAEAPGPIEGEIGVRWLESRAVLVAYHRGDATTLHSTAEALRTWGAAQGYRVTGERREIYHSDARTPLADWTTEIQIYVEGPSDRCSADPTSVRTQATAR